MSLGERIDDTYILTPPAAAGHLPDGAPFDAGTAMIAHSNLSHLAERNVRLIGHALGPGDITLATTFTAPWLASPFETYEPDPMRHLRTIPWSPTESVHFGPIAIAATRLGTAPAGFYPRVIRVVVQHYKSNETFAGPLSSESFLIAALTAGPDTPLHAEVYKSEFKRAHSAVPGAFTTVIDLNVAAPLRPSESWRSRASGTGAPASTTLMPAWLWVGWYSDTVSVPDRVESISAFEVYQ